MRARHLAVAALAAAALAIAAWWALDQRAPADDAAGGELLPGLSARLPALEGLEVRGAGDRVLVSLRRADGRWEVLQRPGWPANEREISRALYRLAGARRIEAKTNDPARHARLGVEDVAAEDAKGAELRLSGGGEPLAVVIGNNHPGLGGSYARVSGEARAWLLDEDLTPARDPVAWLDRRLADLPLARIERVRVQPASGPAFSLLRGEDGFALEGRPAPAMRNPDDGLATAGFADQLALDDVADDDGSAATQVASFVAADGRELVVSAWRDQRGTWARLSLSLDEARAADWFTRAAEARRAAAAAEEAEEAADAAADDAAGEGPSAAAADAAADVDADADANAGAAVDADRAALDAEVAESLAALREDVAGWQARYAGRRFLLPPHKAANLMKVRADYLAR